MFALTIKLVTYPNPIGLKAFWDIDSIIIYEYDKLTDEEFNELLVHEYAHQLCWDLFGIYPKNIYDHDKRCFTNEGRYLIS